MGQFPTPVHNSVVELLSNIVWIITSLALLALTYRGVRSGRVKLSMASAMTLTVVVCFILLPVISISDDLMEARQAALPLSGQTWRVASEGLSVGLDELVTVAFCFLMMMYALLEVRSTHIDQWDVRPFAARLTRSQRLRPPPFAL